MFWWLARVEEGREEVFARGTSFRKNLPSLVFKAK